jgi:hypothetical protein
MHCSNLYQRELNALRVENTEKQRKMETLLVSNQHSYQGLQHSDVDRVYGIAIPAALLSVTGWRTHIPA